MRGPTHQRPALILALATLFLSALALGQPLLAMDLPPGKCAVLSPSEIEIRTASENTTFDKLFPDIASAGDGTAMVAWQSFGTTAGSDTDRNSIHARIFDSEGVPTGPQFQVNQIAQDDQTAAAVAGSASLGRYVVAWSSGAGFGLKVVAARLFSSNGTPLTPEFQVNNFPIDGNGSSFSFEPDVAMAPDGTFIVTWASNDSPGPDDDRSVQARAFSPAGTPLGPQFQVNSFSENPGSGRAQTDPAVAAQPDGDFVIVWTSSGGFGNDNSSSNIQAKRITAAGAPVGQEQQINVFTTGQQRMPSIDIGAGGQSLVVWQSFGSNGSDNDRTSVQARALDEDGAPFGPEFQVNQVTAGDQFEPTVAASPEGGFLVAWESDVSPGSDQDDSSLVARQVASPGRFLGIEFQLNASEADDQSDVAIAFTPDRALATYFSLSFGSENLVWETLLQAMETEASPNALCLNKRRFLVQVDWDSGADQGSGQVVPGGSDDSGLFWFFNAPNWEMLVKVLDGCGINNRFWVFAAATTDVGYQLRVTDLLTGEQSVYQNPNGAAADAVTDTEAFDTCDVQNAQPTEEILNTEQLITEFENAPAEGWLPSWSADYVQEPAAAGLLQTVESANLVGETLELCAAGDQSLCLQSSRFEVTVDFRSALGPGTATRVPFGSADSGLFWFFEPNNWEMLVKVLDGCGINNRFWVFAAATTDVEYTLTVRDTETGAIAEYFNPLGQASPAVTDIEAFATCN